MVAPSADNLTYVSPRVIQVEWPDGSLTSASLTLSQTIVGRSPRNAQIVIHDPFVSRVHLKIAADGDGLVVYDLASTHGTWFDKQRLAPNVAHRWLPGQALRIGDTRLSYQDEDTEEAPPAVAPEEDWANNASPVNGMSSTGPWHVRVVVPILYEDDQSPLPRTGLFGWFRRSR
jgi:pSer/pThr/pTyr-binding forkhead associated (FHA) protein